MDWVVFASCFVLIFSTIFDIVKSIKDKKELSDEHKTLRENHQSLSNEHIQIESLVKEEVQNTKHIVEKDNLQILSIVNNIDRTLIKELERNNIYHNNLTDGQRDIKHHVESISALMKEVERLQSQSINQQKEIKELTQENSELREQLAQYQKQTQTYTNDFTQSMNL